MTLIDQIDREAVALAEKLDRLKAFMDTKEFDSLPELHKVLLRKQMFGMGVYLESLVTRLDFMVREQAEPVGGVA